MSDHITRLSIVFAVAVVVNLYLGWHSIDAEHEIIKWVMQ